MFSLSLALAAAVVRVMVAALAAVDQVKWHHILLLILVPAAKLLQSGLAVQSIQKVTIVYWIILLFILAAVAQAAALG
jgi:hypothetical protein